MSNSDSDVDDNNDNVPNAIKFKYKLVLGGENDMYVNATIDDFEAINLDEYKQENNITLVTDKDKDEKENRKFERAFQEYELKKASALLGGIKIIRKTVKK